MAVGGYLAVSKVLGAKKEEAPEVANFRASLAGMSDLEDLSAMSLDQRERGDARTVGEWKEIIMADGRTYYRNVGTASTGRRAVEHARRVQGAPGGGGRGGALRF